MSRLESSVAMADDELTSELLELEHRGWESLRDGNGAEFYGAVMTDDAVMVLADGTVADRAAVVASLRDSPVWRRFELGGARVVGAGGGAAVLVYTGRAWREESEAPFTCAMTSTYVRTDGGWRLALYTQTPILQSEDSSAARSVETGLRPSRDDARER